MALADKIEFEVLRSVSSPMLSFSGLGIFLAPNPNRVFTQSQIFEAVWNMDSDSCHSSVANVIYNLWKKIEPDSKNPTYLKTVLGIGYKFSADNAEE